MVYGTGDEKLADQLEKRLGDATVDVDTENRPRWFSWPLPRGRAWPNILTAGH